MTDAPELKPCPFCGCGASILDGDTHGNYVECNACESALGRDDGMYEINGDFDGIGDAFRAWNTRADLAKPRVKPLEWVDCDFYCESRTLGLVFSVSLIQASWFYGGCAHSTLEAAKAAAQADYESRVLACLE